MNQDQEYYSLLAEFTQSCERLIDLGQPYLVVILCHELYRFLYPIEPYAQFSNDDPVTFIITHIRSLLELAGRFPGPVTPYEFEFDKFSDDNERKPSTLPEQTADVYSSLWKDFDTQTLTDESLQLLKGRLPQEFLAANVAGNRILDMGCGSGRYSIALARAGAKEVVGIDLKRKSFAVAKAWCQQHRLAVTFSEANFHDLPFADGSFDFVFCNGTLHHSSSITRGLAELARILKSSGKAFLYLYGAGGIFWTTRVALRKIFKRIPINYTKMVLRTIGMPANRFIFCDTWYVPLETHTTRAELEESLTENGFRFEKIVSGNAFDLDRALDSGTPQGAEMWGEGEHRYILEKV
jgi:ubiquinone/menaquinone biosynthesis C-methylase UbiE